jgi:hypothetical protein
MVTNQRNYFPKLSLEVLQSIAQGWAKQYKIVEKIRLCRCIDAEYKAKYVVVLEHSEEPDPEEIRRFTRNLYLDRKVDIFGPSFEEVYKTEPKFRFRDDWLFWWKKFDEDFPDFIDNARSWRLFPPQLIHTEPKTSGKNKVLLCKEGTVWEDIKITLVADDTVRIETPSVKRRFSYHELGMKGGSRGDQPTYLWALLVLFAENHGVISLEDYELSKERKYKAGSSKTMLFDSAKRLNRYLKELFGIEESIYKAHYRKKRQYETRILFSDQTQVV